MAEEEGIRSKYSPPQSEIDEIRKVYKRKQDMAEKRQKFEDEWTNARKQYKREKEAVAEEWQSDIYIPITTSVIEALLSEMVDLKLRPLYLPRESDDRAAATVMNHIFDYTWEVGDGDINLYKVMKEMLICGTGIAQEYYRQDRRVVKELTEFNPEEGVEEYEEREIKDFDDVYMEPVKLEDFYIDENARSFRGPKGARDCIRRYIMHIDDFRKFFRGPIWNPENNAKYVVPGGDTNYYEFYKPPEGLRGKEVEVLWYWNKPEDRLEIVANDVLIRNTPNPYKHKQLPFARAVDMLDPHQFYADGEASILEDLQKERNTIRRMLIDRAHLDIDKMFLASSRETFDEEDLIVRPHGLIQVEDPTESIVPIEYGDVPPSTFKLLEMMHDDTIRVTGYDDRMQSITQRGTATEAAILKESSLRRVRAKVFLLGKEFLVNIARLRKANVQQYYSIPKVEKIVGDKGSRDYREQVLEAKREGRYKEVDGEPYEEKYRTIRVEDKELVKTEQGNVIEKPAEGLTFFEADPDVIRGSLDIKVTSGPTLPVSKPLLQQRMEQMLQHPVVLAGIENGVYEPMKLSDRLLETHDMEPNDFKTEKYAPSEEEPSVGPSQLERLVELAGVENKELMRGKALAPTPYATSKHTEIHWALTDSEEFKALPDGDQRVQNIFNHIYGEEEAQRRRGDEIPKRPEEREKGGQGLLGRAVNGIKGLFGGGGTPAKTPPVEQSRATTPAKKVGGEDVQKIT